jgi:hypothetical protein
LFDTAVFSQLQQSSVPVPNFPTESREVRIKKKYRDTGTKSEQPLNRCTPIFSPRFEKILKSRQRDGLRRDRATS